MKLNANLKAGNVAFPLARTEPMSRDDARKVMTRRAISFSAASRFLPSRHRTAVEILYLFCRTADDLADDSSIGVDDALAGLDHMSSWIEKYAVIGCGSVLRSPIQNGALLGRFAQLVQERNLDARLPRSLIDGVRSDRVLTARENWEELRTYCFQVAGSVGMLLAQTVGTSDPGALAHAATLGVAMQLTNIARDVGEDLDRGIVYLPRDEMAQYGYDQTRLARRVVDADFVALMRAQIERARAHYDAGLAGIGMLPTEARFAFALAGRLYGAILDRVEANGYDVFRRRARSSSHHKALLTASTFLAMRVKGDTDRPTPPASADVLRQVATTARSELERIDQCSAEQRP